MKSKILRPLKTPPTVKQSAEAEVQQVLKNLKDYADPTKTTKRRAYALVKELYAAYCQANFGTDTPYSLNLDHADVCRAIADMIGREWGFPIPSHDDLEQNTPYDK